MTDVQAHEWMTEGWPPDFDPRKAFEIIRRPLYSWQPPAKDAVRMVHLPSEAAQKILDVILRAELVTNDPQLAALRDDLYNAGRTLEAAIKISGENPDADRAD
jgi:hypothetical protein